MNILFFLNEQLLIDTMSYAFKNDFFKAEYISSLDKFIEKIKIETFDIIVIEITNIDIFSLNKLIKFIPNKNKGKIIFISNYMTYEDYNFSINNGIIAYVTKSITLNRLLEIIIAVYTNSTICTSSEPIFSVENSLTGQELKLLQLVADGNTQVEIATVLNISRRTVSQHLRTIYRKLNVSSAISAVVNGIKSGIIVIHDDNIRNIKF